MSAETVGVVGCGVMGAGLAEICARAGLDVRVAVTREASAVAGRERIATSLGRAVGKGKITEDERTVTLGRLKFTTALGDLADCGLVFESVTESEPVKLKLLSQLDSTLKDPDAVIATNTSSLRVERLAQATERPGQVVGTHFFNPVPVMPLVEVVASPLTEEDTRRRVEEFVAGRLGKQVIRSSDQPGFVVNALLVPLLLGAIRMVENGHASAEDVDRGMTLGCGHPMGPLALADFTGLDTLAAVAQSLYDETGAGQYEPPPLLLRMVAAGELGNKTGRGFHRHA